MLTKRKMVQEKTSYTTFLFRLTQTYILQLLQYVRIDIINYKGEKDEQNETSSGLTACCCYDGIGSIRMREKDSDQEQRLKIKIQSLHGHRRRGYY